MRRVVSIALCFVRLMGTGADRNACAEDKVEFFEKHIRPIFVEHCYECHSAKAKKLKGDLRLDTREGVLRGGETGPAVVEGKPNESLLITAVHYHDKDLRMPPPKDDVGRKLADTQINDLVEWVSLGAPMPQDTPSSAARASAATHWAFQPIRNPAVPAVHDEAWIKTDVDRFILAKLEAAGLHPSPPADARTLIRRMTFDLIGLPPTPGEIEAFAREFDSGSIEHRQAAVANLVERLLASPHYGERWARHWLDLARYSDSKGYVYAREERFFVHAHTYRDWVIRAFNTDLPYDRFLLLQIAADQLVPAGSPDLAAMVFITGGRRFIGVMHDIIDDRIDVVTRGTMALTVQCARCHDHKYDPIPTEDYYSLYGVFHDCADQIVKIDSAPEHTEAFTAYQKQYDARAKKLHDTMQKRRDEAAARLRARVGDYLAAQLELQKYPEEGFDQILTGDDIIPASVRRWRDFLRQSKGAGDAIFAPWLALVQIPTAEFDARATGALEHACNAPTTNPLVSSAFAAPPKNAREAADRYGKLFADIDRQWKAALDQAKQHGSPAPAALEDADAETLRRFLYDPHSPTSIRDLGIINNELFFPTSVCEELWKLQGELDRWIIQSTEAPPHALILVDREPEPNPRIFKRGNPARPGEEVPRQFPRVVAGANRHAFQHGSGRLELAQEIVRRDNPLTARVMVNRIWLHHFGAGIVQTPSDFGTRAEPPSHPELLDWLADRFVTEGWSIKRMHRLMMTSAVYQQGSATGPRTPSETNLQLVDADNRLLGLCNRQRLDFEQLHDALLAVSGELDSTMGGKANDMFSATNKRRAIYGLVDRQFLPTSFRVFDFANPDLHIAQRPATTVPQQALFFLNNAFVAARARALAAVSEVAGSSTQDRLQRIYQSVLQRPPTAHEMANGLRFVTAAATDMPPPAPKPPESPWHYGWGEYDAPAKRMKGFNPLPVFNGKAWQGGAGWPDATLGWVQLTADGGHPGNDLQHAVVRRWIAPRDATVAIAGSLVHEVEAGDGVHAFVVSNRHGELRSAEVHNSSAEMAVPSVEVKQGDTIDFVVDIRAGLNSDQFKWAPVITVVEGAASTPAPSVAAPLAWNAKGEFSGPTPVRAPLLTPWEQFVQVLLLSNEFAFVD